MAVRPKAAKTVCANAPLVHPKADAMPPPLPEAIEFAVMKIRSGPGVITKMKTVGMKTISVVSSINIRIAI